MASPVLEEILAEVHPQQVVHDVVMPATVTLGEKLLICVATHHSTGVISNPTTIEAGWDEEFYIEHSSSNRFVGAIWSRTSDGTEGGTSVEVTTEAFAYNSFISHVYRFSNAHGGVDATGDSATTTSASPDSSLHTPVGGTDDYYWLTFVAFIDDAATVSVWPTNYTDNQTYTVSDDGPDNSVALATAGRFLNASSENPGAFTLSESERWMSCTVAVRGAVGTSGPLLAKPLTLRQPLIRH